MSLWQAVDRWRKGRAGPAPDRPGHAGEYQRLYVYLRDRYASRVVLTMSEIQDLLGSALPAPAWLQREWWDTSDPPAPPSAQSVAWTLAGRTAVVNLAARTVAFERQPVP
jgi:hypothetical protein